MLNPNSINRRYITGIDGLRALAVIGVLIYHLNTNWLPGGFLGVTVFFVLSGYLITDLLLSEWKQNKSINLIDFWKRRFRRLLPAVLLMLIIVATWLFVMDQTYLDRLKAEFLVSLLYLNNWWYIFQEVSYANSFGPLSPLTHIWSLAVEEQFYIIWPILLLVILTWLKKRSLQIFIILIGVSISAIWMAYLYTPGTDPTRVYYGTDTRVFSLLLGASLALWWPSENLSMKLTKLKKITLEIVGVIGLLFIIGMFCFVSFYNDFLYQGGMLYLSLATVFIIVNLVHPASYLSKVLSLPPLLWIGTRSYGIYLWHFPIIILTTSTGNTSSVESSTIILQVAATLIISELSYRYVERPIRYNGVKGYMENINTYFSFLPKRFILYTATLAFASILGMSMAMFHQSFENSTIVSASNIEQHEELITETNEEKEWIPTSETLATHVYESKTITFIGDSILHDVAPHFLTYYPHAVVDYQVGRQMTEIPHVIDKLNTTAELGDIIIIQLGTNGLFEKRILEDIITSLGDSRRVLLVNTRVPRPWQEVVNETLQTVAESFSHTTLVDWYTSSTDPSYFTTDQVHLTPTGAMVYAELIHNHLK